VSQIGIFATILTTSTRAAMSPTASLRAIEERRGRAMHRLRMGGRCRAGLHGAGRRLEVSCRGAAPALDALYSLKDDPSEMKNLLAQS
jgi:hypothetical protein